MTTILTHPAVPLAIGVGLGQNIILRRLLFAGICAAIAPDLDVIGLRLGIDYSAAFGHRGFSHSILCALLIATLGAGFSSRLKAGMARTFAFLFLAALSHPILDAFTNGGLGVALLWPWSEHRYFAPLRVIEVAPLSIGRLFSAKGLAVLRSELLWVWLPAVTMALLLALSARGRTKSR